MENQRPKDIRGFEYDWLACDANWRAAFFSTAGSGYAPRELVEDTEAYDRAIDAILAAPATTRARFAPEVIAGRANIWALMAERGLFAYDSDPHGGPYRLVAAPEVAADVADLPEAAADIIGRVVFKNLRFGDVTELTGERLSQR